MPCSADSALRRSIPAFNKDVREVQTKLEDVAFKLRIPQRKPWAPMADDVKTASSIVAQPERVSPAGRLSISLSKPTLLSAGQKSHRDGVLEGDRSQVFLG